MTTHKPASHSTGSSLGEGRACRTDLYIPVRRHPRTFDEHHMTRLSAPPSTPVDAKLVESREEWQRRIQDLRRDFFTIAPHTTPAQTVEHTSTISTSRLIKQNPYKLQEFSAQFDVKNFKPDEIFVSTKNGQLTISATHEETQGNTLLRRRVSRQIDIPSHVRIGLMRAVLLSDGVLSVTAPMESRPVAPPVRLPVKPMITPVAKKPVNESTKTTNATNRPSTLKPTGLDLSLSIAGFQPQEVDVTVEGNKVIVQGQHDVIQKGKSTRSELRKEFTLPDSVNADNIRSYVKEGDTLHIVAQLRHDLDGRIDLIPVNYRI